MTVITTAACPVCTGASEPFTQAPSPDDVSGTQYTMFRCPSCDVAFVSPVPVFQSTSELYAENYYSRWGAMLKVASNAWLASKRRKIEAFAQKGKILDVGCAHGEFLGEMQRHGWEVRGVESSDSARSLLPGTLQGKVFKDVEGVASERFDVITLWHVLEHIPDVKGIVRRLSALLKEDGILFAAVPNLASWEFRSAGADWFHLDLPRHLVHFTPQALTRFLQSEGFEVKRVHHFSWAYNVFGLYQTWLNQITGSRNALYNKFKRRQQGNSAAVAASLVLTPFLLVAAVPASLFLGARGEAGTVEVTVKKVLPFSRKKA